MSIYLLNILFDQWEVKVNWLNCMIKLEWKHLHYMIAWVVGWTGHLAQERLLLFGRMTNAQTMAWLL